MDVATFYGRPRPLRPTSVPLVADTVYAQVRRLLKFPKRGRRLCVVRVDIRTADVGYFKEKTLSDVIGLCSVKVDGEWWRRVVNEHGDTNELADRHVRVQIRRHRRETFYVKRDGQLKAEQWSAGLYLYVKVTRQRC